MKDHIEVTKYVGELFGPIEEEFARIRELAEGLEGTWFVTDGWDDREILLKGWRPMTDLEKDRAEKRRVAAKAAAQAKKRKAEEQERATYEKLKAKYG